MRTANENVTSKPRGASRRTTLGRANQLDPSRPAQLRPVWDKEHRELRLGPTVLKRFFRTAPLLEIILAAFQEENWRREIDDPLPPHDEVNPKRRLHDAINSLNHVQNPHLIRFYGDGTGKGIRWELTDAARQ